MLMQKGLWRSAASEFTWLGAISPELSPPADCEILRSGSLAVQRDRRQSQTIRNSGTQGEPVTFFEPCARESVKLIRQFIHSPPWLARAAMARAFFCPRDYDAPGSGGRVVSDKVFLPTQATSHDGAFACLNDKFYVSPSRGGLCAHPPRPRAERFKTTRTCEDASLHTSRFRVKYAGSEENRAPKNAILEGLGPSIRDTRYAAAKEPSLCLTFPNKWLSWRGFPRARKFTAGRL